MVSLVSDQDLDIVTEKIIPYNPNPKTCYCFEFLMTESTERPYSPYCKNKLPHWYEFSKGEKAWSKPKLNTQIGIHTHPSFTLDHHQLLNHFQVALGLIFFAFARELTFGCVVCKLL